MVEKSKILLIALLLLTAIGLGYAIYQERGVKPAAHSEGLSLIPEMDTATPTMREKEVLNIDPSASEQLKQRHFMLAVSLATADEYLDIGNCTASPLVLKVKDRASFKARNKDTILHRIAIDSQHVFSIPAKSTQTLTADFGKGPGLYGYGCDAGTKTAGLILVVPE
jgi:hypothetical protein